MIPSERNVNAVYGKSAIAGVSGLNPGPQEQMKPSETPASPTIPDNDAEIASINTNPLRGELADIQSGLRRNNVSTSGVQSYRQLLADLIEKREQLSEQAKELARQESMAEDKKAQQQALQEKVDAFKKQLNDLANNTHLDGNKIFTAAGQDMAISVGDDGVIDIPAENLGVNLTDVELSEDTDTLLETVKRAIQEIVEYDGFLIGVEEKLDTFTTLMAFDLQDVRDVEENMAEKNMTLEVGKFSLVRVQEDMRKALRSQANVSPDAAASLLIDTNKDVA